MNEGFSRRRRVTLNSARSCCCCLFPLIRALNAFSLFVKVLPTISGGKATNLIYRKSFSSINNAVAVFGLSGTTSMSNILDNTPINCEGLRSNISGLSSRIDHTSRPISAKLLRSHRKLCCLSQFSTFSLPHSIENQFSRHFPTLIRLFIQFSVDYELNSPCGTISVFNRLEKLFID